MFLVLGKYNFGYVTTSLRGAPQVDNLNAKCKPFSAVACLAKMGSICRLGVYNIIQKSFKLVVVEGGKGIAMII